MCLGVHACVSGHCRESDVDGTCLIHEDLAGKQSLRQQEGTERVRDAFRGKRKMEHLSFSKKYESLSKLC